MIVVPIPEKIALSIAMKEFNIQLLRIVIAAPLGFWIIDALDLWEGIFPALFFFGVYVVVSLLIEIFRKLLTK